MVLESAFLAQAICLWACMSKTFKKSAVCNRALLYSFDSDKFLLKRDAFTDNLDDYLGRAITRQHLPDKK